MKNKNWHTPINWGNPGNSYFGYHKPIVMLGSCFAENMSDKFTQLGFKINSNPFGILFNPISLSKILDPNFTFETNRIVQKEGMYVHLDAHSRIHSTSVDGLIERLKGAQKSLNSDLKEASHLVLTFGTSWAYSFDRRIVGNCHKQPQTIFEKKLLTIQEMYDQLYYSLSSLIKQNPALNIVLTVSPVRHIKDGLIENNRGKSRLIELAHLLEETIDNCLYFPAYEIQMDELRDYRFYKSDMLHPNDDAVDYIFELFSNEFTSEKTREIMKLQEQLFRLKNHRGNINIDKIEALERNIALLMS